jgi:hypothetical protein
MTTVLRRIAICIGIILLWIPGPDCFAEAVKNALVIGNSAYKTAGLANPVNDATDMADTLKKLGFKVTLKTNATQKAMEESIRAFGKELRKGGIGLFYYAGHGIQVKGRNYLIPIEAVLESEGDAKYEAVDAGLVLAKMEDAGNGFNIVILDACRNNPFSRSFRSADTGLAKMDAPAGSILAYSTAPGSIAADSTGRNGLYTSRLLEHMVTPNLKIEEVFKKVRVDVAMASEKKQTPWESSSLMGDFYFNSGRSLFRSYPVRSAIVAQDNKLNPANRWAVITGESKSIWDLLPGEPPVLVNFLDTGDKPLFFRNETQLWADNFKEVARFVSRPR